MLVDFKNITFKIHENDAIYNSTTKRTDNIIHIDSQAFEPSTGILTVSYQTINGHYIDQKIKVSSSTVTDRSHSLIDIYPTVTATCVTCGRTETKLFTNLDDDMYILQQINRHMKFSTKEDFDILFDIYKNHNDIDASLMILMKVLHEKNVLQYCNICGYKEKPISN